MLSIYVKDFDDWRVRARSCLVEKIPPDLIHWVDIKASQGSLFSAKDISHSNKNERFHSVVTVPLKFIAIAKKVSCHRDLQKWFLLYDLVWRISNGEKNLLFIRTDPLMHKIYLMLKAVGRDMHKMKAFVRFQVIIKKNIEHYVAWYKPDHPIIKAVAPFFKNRFKIMQWTIFTPDGIAHWNGEQLVFAEAEPHFIENATTDNMASLWQVYYRAIFNPARIKLKAMRREMPVRFWKNMPETLMIPTMLQEAPSRVTKMLKYTEGWANTAQSFLPDDKSLESLKNAAKKCQGCPLHQFAKQTVFGVGPLSSNIMLVGEQPGDTEDKIGQPFQGPAGKILQQILKDLGINSQEIYMTNAVKHFKFKHIDNKRLHRSPHAREINACKPWLESEIDAIQPQVIICLGLIAARSLVGHGFTMKEQRGKCLEFSKGINIIVTYHPSAVLRAKNSIQQNDIYNCISQDINYAVEITKHYKVNSNKDIFYQSN